MAYPNRRKTRETVTTHLVDGEIREQLTQETYTLPSEPPYVKLYLTDIILLKGLPKSNADILHELLKHMSWENKLYIMGALKRDVCTKLEIEMVTVSKALERFVKEEILYRHERGVYLVNPYLFGKGPWKDIDNIRLQVNYSSKGREVVTKIKRPSSLPESTFDN